MQDTVKSVSDTLFLKNNNNAFINIGVARIYDLWLGSSCLDWQC